MTRTSTKVIPRLWWLWYKIQGHVTSGLCLPSSWGKIEQVLFRWPIIILIFDIKNKFFLELCPPKSLMPKIKMRNAPENCSTPSPPLKKYWTHYWVGLPQKETHSLPCHFFFFFTLQKQRMAEVLTCNWKRWTHQSKFCSCILVP